MSIRRRLPLLALLVLLGPTAARAEDACLTGPATLGDQRAFATLRADMEAACPCVEATNRGPYRRCVKGVVKTALGGGALRAECAKAARRLLRGAGCGDARVACGRVQIGGKTPVSCRLKKAKACTDRVRFSQTACSAQDFCADVVEWTAGTCSDVRAPGPFGVGARHVTLTKQSVVHPEQERVLSTTVWYPTAPGGGPIDGLTRGVLDAPVDLSGGPYPIVLFSHGSCGYPEQSTFLTTLLASRGFVVVAPPHPGNTIFQFPACGAPQTQVESAVERPVDMLFALDEMTAATADAGSPFFGALDPSRVAMTGHSFGGFTTYFVAADPRIKAAIPMAPAAPPNAMLGVPSLTMLSVGDSVVNTPAARTAYDNSSSPKYRVEIENTGHYAYSDGCFPSADCNPPVTLTQAEAHAAVLRWVIPFLEWRLRGDDTFAAFFEQPPPPGVVFEAAP